MYLSVSQRYRTATCCPKASHIAATKQQMNKQMVWSSFCLLLKVNDKEAAELYTREPKSWRNHGLLCFPKF